MFRAYNTSINFYDDATSTICWKQIVVDTASSVDNKSEHGIECCDIKKPRLSKKY
jgi:hypothetical protein